MRTKAMRTAYSYQRFSSIKQREGDSTRRQNNAAEMFCRHHGLVLADTFRDEGISGFKGKNFSNESALGAFLQLVEKGAIQPGSVLVVENMDRLSRQSILPCIAKFTEIISKGISIGVIAQNRILDEASISANPMELMLVVSEFYRAHSESAVKSVRAKAVIAAKIDRIKKGERVFISQKPTWIVGLDKGRFILDQRRVSIVQEVFRLYLSGESCNHIANQLNTKKTPTLRDGTGIWTNSTVASLLKNKNVIGWYGINNQTVENYYPAIVSAKDFRAAQLRLAQNVKDRGGSKYGFVRNLFKGLCFCAGCGQVMEVKIGSYANVRGKLNHYAHYICRGVKQQTECNNKGRVAVSYVEMAIFESVLFSRPSSLLSKAESSTSHVSAFEDQIAKLQLAIDRLTDMIVSADFKDLASLKEKLKRTILQKTAIEKQQQVEIDRLTLRQESPKAAKTLFSLFSAKFTDDAATTAWAEEYNKLITDTKIRKQLKSLMPNLLGRIEIRFKGKLTEIACTLVGGERVTATVFTETRYVLISMNDPVTKAPPAPFRLLKSGQRIPVNEPA